MRCHRSLIVFLIVCLFSVFIFSFSVKPAEAVAFPYYAQGFSGYPRTDGGTYSNASIDQVIAVMNSENLTAYRMTFSSGTNPNPYIAHYLESCSYDLIVDYWHTYPPGSLSSADKAASIAKGLTIIGNFSAYESRMFLEPCNEANNTDLATFAQSALNAFTDAGWMGGVLVDKFWTQTWSSFAAINASLNNFFTGGHYYQNEYSLSYMESQMTTALGYGLKLINTEVGANYNEWAAFTQAQVDNLETFIFWCQARAISNMVWMRYNIANWVGNGVTLGYEPMNLDFPQLTWYNAETWTVNIQANATWRSVESWIMNAQTSGHWSTVESWTINAQATTNWTSVENWTIAIYSHTEAWYSAENWSVLVNGTAAWFDVETWSVNVSTYLAGFHDVETWNVTINAQKQSFSWSPDIQFHLTLPDTYIGFTDTAYFDSFTFSEDYLTFVNLYMDSGIEIPSLKIEMTGGNVSFSMLSYLDLVSFTFHANVGTTVTLSLTGLDTMPYNVTIDGEGYGVGTRWTWDGTILTVSYVMPSSSSNVVLSWATITETWQTAESWNVDLNPGGAIISGVTWYFRSNTITANSITGYELSATMDSTLSSVTQNLGVSSDSIQFGVMAYMVNSHNISVSLTGDVPTAIITRSDVGMGLDSATVAVPETALTLGYDTIDVKLYIRLSSGGWLLSAEFTSQRLMYTRLIGSIWQFNLYTNKSLDGSGNTIATASWGDSTHVSGISGLSFKTPTPQELSIYYAGRGDWIHAVLYPYMIYAGDAVYGLGFLFVGGVLYLRHKKWEVILVCLFLFGGSTGLGFLIPDAAYRLLYVVVAFALTWLLVKVFK